MTKKFKVYTFFSTLYDLSYRYIGNFTELCINSIDNLPNHVFTSTKFTKLCVNFIKYLPVYVYTSTQ